MSLRSDNLDSVVELYTQDDLRQLVVAIEPAPAVLENPEGSGGLYSYEIATGKISFVQQLKPGVYATADLRDANNIYMAHFGTREDVWKGRVRLIMIKAESLRPESQ